MGCAVGHVVRADRCDLFNGNTPKIARARTQTHELRMNLRKTFSYVPRSRYVGGAAHRIFDSNCCQYVTSGFPTNLAMDWCRPT